MRGSGKFWRLPTLGQPLRPAGDVLSRGDGRSDIRQKGNLYESGGDPVKPADHTEGEHVLPVNCAAPGMRAQFGVRFDALVMRKSLMGKLGIIHNRSQEGCMNGDEFLVEDRFGFDRRDRLF